MGKQDRIATNRSVERISAHYRMMCRIRAFEYQAEAALKAGEVGGAVHMSIGQEAIASGVCGNLETADQITTTHRGHGHAIAKGTDPQEMMLELFGRAGGTCGGKGGSMHIADFSVGMLGANGVVGAGIQIAVGAAHGARIRGDNRVVVCFFGDGAVNRGPFLEGLNWAKIYNLPVLFVCEVNQFASTTRTAEMTAGDGPAARARGIGVEAFDVDGNDVVAVDDLVQEVLEPMRSGGGPVFLAAHTYRLAGHTAADPGRYRDPDEVAEHWRRDPIAQTALMLRDLNVSEATLQDWQDAAENEMAAARRVAQAAPYPDPATAFDDVQDIGAPVWGG